VFLSTTHTKCWSCLLESSGATSTHHLVHLQLDRDQEVDLVKLVQQTVQHQLEVEAVAVPLLAQGKMEHSLLDLQSGMQVSGYSSTRFRTAQASGGGGGSGTAYSKNIRITNYHEF